MSTTSTLHAESTTARSDERTRREPGVNARDRDADVKARRAARIKGAVAAAGASPAFRTCTRRRRSCCAISAPRSTSARRSPKKFKADTGIEIQYIAVTTDDVAKRAVTAAQHLRPGRHRVLLAQEDRAVRQARGHRRQAASSTPTRSRPLLHQGRGRRQEDRRPGHGAEEGDVPRRARSSNDVLARRRPQCMTLIPTTYNADTLGIRPDLIKRPIDVVGRAAEPGVQGQGGAAEHSRRSASWMRRWRSRPWVTYKYGDKGNMTKAEIDQTIKIADRGQAGGPVPRVLEGLQREREPDGLGRGGDPVDVVAGGHRRCARRALRAPSSRSRKAIAPGRRASAFQRTLHGQEARCAPTSSSTGSWTAGPAPI